MARAQPRCTATKALKHRPNTFNYRGLAEALGQDGEHAKAIGNIVDYSSRSQSDKKLAGNGLIHARLGQLKAVKPAIEKYYQ